MKWSFFRLIAQSCSWSVSELHPTWKTKPPLSTESLVKQFTQFNLKMHQVEYTSLNRDYFLSQEPFYRGKYKQTSSGVKRLETFTLLRPHSDYPVDEAHSSVSRGMQHYTHLNLAKHTVGSQWASHSTHKDTETTRVFCRWGLPLKIYREYEFLREQKEGWGGC